MMTGTLTLYELNNLVREVIESELSHEYWVEAELSEVRESRGHCYMELIEKDKSSNTPIARASAKCWRSSWLMIQPHFERVTQQRLHAGMKVRLKVYAQFHEAYGFSWIVTDIDPNYTLGDMARRLQEIIAQLKQEGVFDLQHELSFPLFCQRIAVISSQTAAGYGDFCNQLNDSPFAFQVQLFPATMQGEQVEKSIVAALNRIYEQADDFDAVVIIRGGGATSDMSGFDTLTLAENVAQFPLPIITGIGHDRDESILDMVSHTRVKTPTAAAAFLIDQLQAVMERIETAEQRITHQAQVQLSLLHSQLSILSERIPTLFSLVRTRHEARINQLSTRLSAQLSARLGREQHQLEKLGAQLSALTERRLLTERHRLEMLEQRVASLDPQLLLKRGYSITLYKGKAVRNTTELKTGDKIETRLSEGTIKSIVT
jgi:exodeoxyribonuclease VII large subunit